MILRRRASLTALALSLAAALALSACSSGADEGLADGEEGGDGEDEGAGGGERTFITTLNSNIDNFNPQVSGRTPPTFAAQMLDPLVLVDDASEIVPWLAESWELSEDGLELTLHLVETNWHDGEPFTSADVAYNVEVMFELTQFGADLWRRLDSVETPDDRTAIIQLTEPFGPILEALSQQFMLPKHVYDGTDILTNPANLAPVGTGPFMFDSHTDGEQVVTVKNPDYFAGEPAADRVVSVVMPDANSRSTSLFADEIDMATVPASWLVRLDERPNLQQVTTGYFPQYASVMFNTESEYLQDPEVRRLLFSALDRQQIADTALGGLGTPATGFFHPDSWGVNPDIDFDSAFDATVDEINAGLDAAGFPVQADGERFTLQVRWISSITEIQAIAELARSSFAEFGVGLELLPADGTLYTEQVYNERDFDLSFSTTILGPDPSLGITRWYTCNDANIPFQNGSGVCDEQITEASNRAIASIDRDERTEAFHEIQERSQELIFNAPLAWYDGGFPVVNSTRWDGLDSPPPGVNMGTWLSMTPAD